MTMMIRLWSMGCWGGRRGVWWGGDGGRVQPGQETGQEIMVCVVRRPRCLHTHTL